MIIQRLSILYKFDFESDFWEAIPRTHMGFNR